MLDGCCTIGAAKAQQSQKMTSVGALRNTVYRKPIAENGSQGDVNTEE